jgi:hypothetical protein
LDCAAFFGIWEQAQKDNKIGLRLHETLDCQRRPGSVGFFFTEGVAVAVTGVFQLIAMKGT